MKEAWLSTTGTKMDGMEFLVLREVAGKIGLE